MKKISDEIRVLREGDEVPTYHEVTQSDSATDCNIHTYPTGGQSLGTMYGNCYKSPMAICELAYFR